LEDAAAKTTEWASYLRSTRLCLQTTCVKPGNLKATCLGGTGADGADNDADRTNSRLGQTTALRLDPAAQRATHRA
jgi:hypothetical protein